MSETELFLLFTRRLEQLRLRYMVSGSIAAIYYGEPRMTNDVDIVLVLPLEGVEEFAAAFPLDQFYCPPVDVIRLEQARAERGHLNLIHHDTGFKADLYLARRDGLHLWGLEHVRLVSLGTDRIRLAPPEYVILRKLQFFSEGRSQKHLRDIQRMCIGLGEEWNRETLLAMVCRYGLTEEWKEALAFED
ncbi:MAG: hypothetical protein KAY24_11835 [Candidatus Eisenbacteria sp.]|nr:hypothetical protein [Candidatus Eisenbacteria bacterium]